MSYKRARDKMINLMGMNSGVDGPQSLPTTQIPLSQQAQPIPVKQEAHDWGQLLDAKSGLSYQRFLFFEAPHDTFLVNIQCWDSQPNGADSFLFDHKRDAVVALAHGRDAQHCLQKLNKEALTSNDSLDVALPNQAILKAIRNDVVLRGFMYSAAMYRNKRSLIMWAPESARPNRLRKIAMKMGLVPEQRSHRQVYIRKVNGEP